MLMFQTPTPTQAAQAFNESVDLLIKAGVAIAAIVALILVLVVLLVMMWAFFNRSRSADKQLDRQVASNEKLSTTLDSMSTTLDKMNSESVTVRESHQQWQERQVEALKKINDVINGFQQASTNADVNLSNQMNGMQTSQTNISKQLETLIEQGNETLGLLRRSPNEHETIKTKIEELITAVQKDKARQTNEVPLPPAVSPIMGTN